MMKNTFAGIRTFHVITFMLFTLFGLRAKAQMHGNYAEDNGKKHSSGYKMLKIHATPADALSFYLEVSRGAPDYNSGSLYGKLTHDTETGNYEYKPKKGKGGCKLIFVKLKTTITIKTAKGDCGFGYGVTADGKYALIDHNNPKDFTDRTGKKIYFDKTSPDKYSE